MPLVVTRGPKVGRCNISGVSAKLTSDHVPPKGTNRFPRMQLHRLVDSLGARPGERTRGRQFQQGVKFRSLCEVCNRDVLGTLCDPELVSFANSVSEYLRSPINLPAMANFRVRPGLVARAVAGHILAIGVERFPRGEMGDAVADFVLDAKAQVPEKLGIYYWPYPYWDQISIRGCCYLVRWGAPPLVISVLKFMPLAFMVTWDVDPGFSIPHINLTDLIVGSGSAAINIPINFRNIPRQRYPEAPDDDGIVLHGADSYFAERKR